MSQPPTQPVPEAVRRQILDAAVGGEASFGGAIFELVDSNSRIYRPTLESAASSDISDDFEISSGSLLARWLRVNQAVLPVPDAAGVFESLTTREQQSLRSKGVTACIPLMFDGALIGWVALSGPGSAAFANSRQMVAKARNWAEKLHVAKSASLLKTRTESVSRTNRLSITGQLAATIGHEIRNPLAAIRSTVQMIRDADAPPADHHRLLGTVIDEVDRVNDVLTRMLTLGRPHQSTPELCSLASIADDAADFCAAYARRRGQRIERSGVDALWIVGDAFELRQVLVNTLLNASQASTHGDTIRLETSNATDDKSWATVTITDTGTGIPQDDLGHVFDPFFTTKPDGAGLGLAICREIVQRHGGSISIQSRHRVGTTVLIQLPRTETHAANLSR